MAKKDDVAEKVQVDPSTPEPIEEFTVLFKGTQTQFSDFKILLASVMAEEKRKYKITRIENSK